MNTKLKVKPLANWSSVSIGELITAAVLPIISFSTQAEPLDCSELTQAIEQNLIAKGVAHYELSVAAKDDPAFGKRVVGTCASGTKKIFYSKKTESVVSKVAVDDPRDSSRKTEIKTTNSHGGTHKFVGTKKELTLDPWMRTKEVWGLTFTPNFEYEIRVRSERADVDTQTCTTITEIRYKNSEGSQRSTSGIQFRS